MQNNLYTAMTGLCLLLCSCNDSSFSGGSDKEKSARKPAKDKSENASPKEEEEEPSLGGKTDHDQSPSSEPEEEPDADDEPEEDPVIAADDVMANVDTSCANGSGGGGLFAGPIAPKDDKPETVPASCQGGIEFNNLENSSFQVRVRDSLKAAVPLDIDIASYTAADRIRIHILTKDGQRKLVLDSCRLRTASYIDPTDGNSRPPEDSIREFRMKLPKGTQAIEFDFNEATSPTYMRVRGLCDFNLTPAAVQGGQPNLRTI